MALVVIKETLCEIAKLIAKKTLTAVTAGTVGYEIGKTLSEPNKELVQYNSSVEKVIQNSENIAFDATIITVLILVVLFMIAITVRLFFLKNKEHESAVEMNARENNYEQNLEA